jgi:hypothetical protein
MLMTLWSSCSHTQCAAHADLCLNADLQATIRASMGFLGYDVHGQREQAVMAPLYHVSASKILIAAATHFCGAVQMPDVRLAPSKCTPQRAL